MRDTYTHMHIHTHIHVYFIVSINDLYTLFLLQESFFKNQSYEGYVYTHAYTCIYTCVDLHTDKGGVTLIKVGIMVNSTILIFLSSPLEHLQRPGNTGRVDPFG